MLGSIKITGGRYENPCIVSENRQTCHKQSHKNLTLFPLLAPDETRPDYLRGIFIILFILLTLSNLCPLLSASVCGENI